MSGHPSGAAEAAVKPGRGIRPCQQVDSAIPGLPGGFQEIGPIQALGEVDEGEYVARGPPRKIEPLRVDLRDELGGDALDGLASKQGERFLENGEPWTASHVPPE